MLEFAKLFNALTENDPFDWQERLFARFISGDFPSACDIPTGLGKTHVMTIWLIALGYWLNQSVRKLPLRLVYVVDRRVIVDQATEEAEKIQTKLNAALKDESSPLHQLAKTFRAASLKGDESLLTISTLRGQRADNREWCMDPSRPAIIVGTVDMIGSRMLFTGYGKVGINHRSLQAGLLGQDSLIVIDEAHLSPCFVATQHDIQGFVQKGQPLRPFHVMTLSATLSNSDNTLTFDEEKECRNNIAARRLNARKHIEWLPFDQTAKVKDDRKKTSSGEIREALAECLVRRAIQHEAGDQSAPPQSVIVFAQTVELVNLIYDKLKVSLEEKAMSGVEVADKQSKKAIQESIDQRILKMTGEMRGAERDKLVESEKFQAFSPINRDRTTPRYTQYLIATSCAEVGVNLDADHGLCDLSTLDSMIQRLGRINRFGLTDSTITVVIDEKGLNTRADDLEKDAEHQRNLDQLAAEIAALRAQPEIVKSDKSAKQALQKELKAKDERYKKAVKQGAEYEQKLITRENEKVFFTWRALQSRNGIDGKVNASPLALRGLLTDYKHALPDELVRPPFEQARLDDWAMTSLKQKEYPRPLVHYWLRGVIADEQAQTTFVWRSAHDQFTHAEKLSDNDLIELAAAIPVQPKERAPLATFRGENLLKALAGKAPDRRIIITDSSGESLVYSLKQLRDKNRLFELLAFSTVILPGDLGGLDDDGNPLDKLPKAALQPVEDAFGASWTQYLITCHSSESVSIKLFAQRNDETIIGNTFLSWQAAVRSIKNNGVCRNAEAIRKAFTRRLAKDETDKKDDEVKSYIAVFFDWKAEAEQKASHEAERLLQEGDDEIASLDYPAELTVVRHNNDVGGKARQLAEKLRLPPEIVDAVAAAGFRHDLGKAREWWQKAIGNFDYNPSASDGETDRALAKSRPDIKSFDHDFNQGYRHEFGSLVESLDDPLLTDHPHRDLILHLIASHHGFARPHFPERAFDRRQPRPLSRQIAHETLLRFDRLQRQYGWWQLAYLEAVLKAADALASSDFSESQRERGAK